MHHHCTSQVFHYGTSDADACIIVASDGVWEFMPSEDAVSSTALLEHRSGWAVGCGKRGGQGGRGGDSGSGWWCGGQWVGWGRWELRQQAQGR